MDISIEKEEIKKDLAKIDKNEFAIPKELPKISPLHFKNIVYNKDFDDCPKRILNYHIIDYSKLKDFNFQEFTQIIIENIKIFRNN